MENLIHADIFFFVTTVVTVIVAALVIVVLFYVVRIVRDVRRIADIARGAAETIAEDAGSWRRFLGGLLASIGFGSAKGRAKRTTKQPS